MRENGRTTVHRQILYRFNEKSYMFRGRFIFDQAYRKLDEKNLIYVYFKPFCFYALCVSNRVTHVDQFVTQLATHTGHALKAVRF